MGWFDDVLDHVPGVAEVRVAERCFSGDANTREHGLAQAESAMGELGVIPGLGNVMNGAGALYHAGAAIHDGVMGDRNAAINHGTQAAWNAIGTVAPLPLSVMDSAASTVAMHARIADGQNGGTPDTYGGISDMLGAAAEGLTDMVAGPDDSNWIAPGDVPLGTRGGEIEAGTAAMLGPLGMLANESGVTRDVAETLGADYDSGTSGTRHARAAVQDRERAERADARAERAERNARFDAEVHESMPAPHVPGEGVPDSLRQIVEGDRESQTSILANRAGLPMDRLMRLGPDGRWVYDEAAIAEAQATVRARENGEEPAAAAEPAAAEPARAPRHHRRRAPRHDDMAGGHLSPSGRWISDDEPGGRRRGRYGR